MVFTIGRKKKDVVFNDLTWEEISLKEGLLFGKMVFHIRDLHPRSETGKSILWEI